MNKRANSVIAVSVLVQLLTIGVLAQGPGMGRMQGEAGPNMQDMKTIHALFDAHTKITRTVTNTENGVTTTTESDDPKVQGLLAEHVWAMQQRLAKKQPIRQWDPLFAELFRYSEKINMEVSKTPRGMRVIETSTDPYVVKLIQAHAAGVSEFTAKGMSVMHVPHPLPGETSKEESSFIGKGDGISTCPVTGEPVNKEFKFGFYGRTVYFCCSNCVEEAKSHPERYIKP